MISYLTFGFARVRINVIRIGEVPLYVKVN